jgi:hypothetical protein
VRLQIVLLCCLLNLLRLLHLQRLLLLLLQLQLRHES